MDFFNVNVEACMSHIIYVTGHNAACVDVAKRSI